MKDLKFYIKQNLKEGANELSKNLSVHIISSPKELTCTISEPNFGFCVSGKKSYFIGDKEYVVRAGEYALSVSTLPNSASIQASPKEPFIMISVRLSRELIRQVMSEFTGDLGRNSCYCAFKFASGSEAILSVIKRLVMNKNAEFVENLLLKELVFHLLNSDTGAFLNSFLNEGSAHFGIDKAITFMRQNYASKLAVPEIAEISGLSQRCFYLKFKSVTGLTPVSFIRLLRLNAAQELMAGGTSAARAAMSVGYESASHFSRDYASVFGMSPRASVGGVN